MEHLVLALVLGGIGSTVIFIHKMVKLQKSSTIALVMLIDTTIQSLLYRCVESTHCDRAIVVKFHNGGAKIMVGTKKYITVIAEPSNSLEPKMKEDYHRIPADPTFVEIVNRMLRDGLVLLETTEMEPGMLRRKFEADGITSAVLFPYQESETGLYFGMFCSKSDPHEYLGGSADFSKLETLSNQIGNQYERSRKKRVLQ